MQRRQRDLWNGELVYELAEQEEGFAERIHVIAGVTAAASGGACWERLFPMIFSP